MAPLVKEINKHYSHPLLHRFGRGEIRTTKTLTWPLKNLLAENNPIYIYCKSSVAMNSVYQIISHLLKQVEMLFCVYHIHFLDFPWIKKLMSHMIKITLYIHNGIFSRDLEFPWMSQLLFFLTVTQLLWHSIKIISCRFLQKLISCQISTSTAKSIPTASLTFRKSPETNRQISATPGPNAGCIWSTEQQSTLSKTQ